jgi:hypothetical protein
MATTRVRILAAFACRVQIEEDARSGKLREAYNRLKREHAGEPEIPLDEFLDNEKLS